jgi:hypothetical protein
MRKIKALHTASIRDIISDENLINVTLGPKNDLIVLSLKETPDYRIVQPGWASFAKNRADQLNTFTIRHQSHGTFELVELSKTSENYSFVQPLPDDNWFLARSRAQDSSDQNAHVYDSAGQVVSSFHAGDAIQDVQVTADGQIWISYFDEAAALAEGIGGKGLAGFDRSGRLVFGYDELVEEHELPPIADCYAMNVASDGDVWICYYTDFPLVRIVNRQLGQVWHNIPLGGASAFAVTERRVLFAGFYRNPHSLFLVDLRNMETEEISPIDHHDQPIQFRTPVGRGSHLLLVTDTDIFNLDLNSF